MEVCDRLKLTFSLISLAVSFWLAVGTGNSPGIAIITPTTSIKRDLH